ncbi:MAG: hypothetical protein WKG07_07600 [Hymenobacter sp.]
MGYNYRLEQPTGRHRARPDGAAARPREAPPRNFAGGTRSTSPACPASPWPRAPSPPAAAPTAGSPPCCCDPTDASATRRHPRNPAPAPRNAQHRKPPALEAAAPAAAFCRRRPMYGGAVCADLFARGLCLPSGTAMGDDELRHVAKALREIV